MDAIYVARSQPPAEWEIAEQKALLAVEYCEGLSEAG